MRPPDMLAILFLVVIAIPVARADCDTFVSPSGNDTGSCAAVTSPCLTIRYAATAGLSALREGSCNASVTVFLLPGVYTGPDNKNLELDGRSLNFSLFSLQAFTSNNAKLRDHPHPQVLIDLELNGTFLHVMFNENVQQKLTVMGLAIHGASNVGQLNCGGALFADGPGEVDVTNCTFVGNQIYAASQGSAICAHQAHVFVDESRFNNNTGGAVVVLNGALDVHHSTFISNTIESSDGAAIFAYYADVTLHKATFTNNFGLQPTVFGGATVIAQYGHLLNISHCTFTINSGGLRGGAVEIGPTAQVWITDSQFVGNNAHTGGAILIGWEYESVMQVSAVNITNCKFTGNHADLGGAIALLGATNTTAYVVDSTFSLNRGDESGGAVYESLGSSVFATPVYDNCIFENNVAAGRGGAMHLHGSGSIVTNCTFTGNSAYDGGGIFAERCAGGNVTCACLDTDDCSLALLDSTVETNHAIDNGGGIFCTCKLFFGTNVLRGNEAQGELTDMACKDCTWENQNEDNLCLPNPEPAPLSPPRGLHLPWWLWVTVGMIVALVLITGSVAVAMCSGSNTEEQHPLIDAPRKRKRTVTINN